MARVPALAALVVLLLGLPGLAAAHEDEEFAADGQAPYVGEGWREADGGSPDINFKSQGVKLRSWLPLQEFAAGATRGNNCWGYTSPSGREYALIGLDTGTGVAEVTYPGNTHVVAHLAGPTSAWRDIKTYQHYAYVVSEGGGGIQVFDLDQIDNGVIVQLPSVTTGDAPLATHNVAINETSGRLYRVGGGVSPVKGLRIFSLEDPAAPVFIGAWNNRYCHDAQVVSWTEPPYAGVEVAFCYANNTSSGVLPGIDILDVTNPAAITLIGSINLAVPPIFSHPAQFSHQGWLSPDRHTLYMDDEVDEATYGSPTLTRIIDVQDLSNPRQVAVFTNTTAARDHNLYTLRTLIFQANYRSGFRLLEAVTPVLLSQIGYFDTYPPDDDAHYNGLWNVYPYFPSGTVIGSDIEKGLFVWTLSAAQVPALSPLAQALITLLFVGIGTFAARRWSPR